MLRKSLCIVFMLSFVFSLQAAEKPHFHRVKAEKGDGVYSLLRKYELLDHPCNIQKFYELNKIGKTDRIYEGKLYYIPVYIYQYNGKSIRSTINKPDWNAALRIKSFNEEIKSKGLRQTSYIVSKILWVPFHELSCDNTKVSESPIKESDFNRALEKSEAKPVSMSENIKTLHMPLFGNDYKNVPIIDNTLQGKVYYLVSGHGGPDPGAVCTECEFDLCEDEYAYDVTLRLARNLLQHGAIVHMIIKDHDDGIRDEAILKCDKDEVCLDARIPIRQKIRLQQRAHAINNLHKMYKKRGVKEQYAVVIHVDSRNKKQRQDVFFYYYKGSKTSKGMAKDLQKTFKAKYDKYQKNRGYKGYIKDRGLYMLANTLPPAVYIELANIRNPDDHERLLRSENRQALANWLMEGLTKIKT
jgi:N-acetylmuramoyl-L-alanine amidase